MSLASDIVLGKLDAVDQSVRQAHGPLGSLAPGRLEATSLRALGERALELTTDAATLGAFGEALIAIVEAECANFPGNLFWDHDLLAQTLLTQALRAEQGPVAHLGEASALIVQVHELFGRHSAIQFRYTHDFLYGFDWARWVKRDPDERGAIGPYDLPFLAYSRVRGHELLTLIDQDDAKYPRMEPGTSRNPFGFSREPEHEARLHRDLAARGFVPVPAWDPHGQPTWDRPYQEIRETRAGVLLTV